MALTTCKECGGKMSDRATECPHCGCPREFQDEIHPTDNSSAQSHGPLTEQPQQNPKKPHKGLWISLAAILVVALCAGAFLLFGGTSTLKITPEFTKALQRYDQIDAFSEGMAAVRRDGKWGYINLQGEEVIPCQFSDAFPPGQFSEGLACVVDERNEEDKKLWNSRVGFINKRGEFVITGDYFTEAPTLGTVWYDESHKLPSFKDGKCVVWNTAVYSLNDENTESGWSKEYEANDVVLIDSKGKIGELTDSTAYQIGDFHPYVIPTPYREVIKPTETKVVFDDYAINIARDTVDCDNGAKLVTWQIIDANSYPYGGYGGTYEKTCQYYIDQYGNSTLTPEQEKSMEQHLNGLVTLLSKKHKEQELQIAREEWEQNRKEEEERNRVEWIYGTWEYSMVVDMGRYLGGRKQMNSKVIISEDNITVYTNGELDYNGGYTIENGAIIYDRHKGYCSSLPLDFTNKRIEADRNGKYFTKVSSSASEGYTSNAASSNNSSYTTFRTEADVWAYLSSTVFYGRGTRFRLTPRYMEVDGSPATGGVRVINFNGSRATLQASSPYIGGSIVTLYVNAANGSISSGGEVFYSK